MVANEAAPAQSSTVLATVHGTGPERSGVAIAVTSLRRDSSTTVTLAVTITNGGSEPMSYSVLAGSGLKYSSMTASGVTLIDPVAKLRYYPLRDTDNNCVCTPFPFTEDLSPGARTDAIVTFPAPPKNVSSLTVNWDGFTLAGGVPLS
ncbi:hypothetical protein [Frankia sp. R82]|uniref:hypothetical protein n=1 Tax=Frankia sp. R82 TaxID=2950553 RepID=UPI0020439F5D|nr:hypothetical protein [Frankia sp. R82]